MNYDGFVHALREGVAAPILEYLGRGFGYTPAPGEYPYVLAFPKQTISADGTSGILSESISQDSGFLWEGVVYDATSEDFTILLRESGKELQFMNRAVHSALFSGTIQRPGYVSLKPYYFRPNTTIQLTLSDISSSENVIWFALIGRRLKSDPGAFQYTRGPLSRT